MSVPVSSSWASNNVKKAEMYFPVERKFLFVYGLRILSRFIFGKNAKPSGSTRAGVTRFEFKNFDNSKNGLPDQP